MKQFSLYRVELRRLFLSKRIWISIVLCFCTPLLGYSLYKTTFLEDMAANEYIANPMLAAALAGAVIWALLTILETDRQFHSGTEAMTDSAASPVALAAARAMAMGTISGMTTVICALLYLPYTSVKMDYLFSAGFYFGNYLVFVLLTWWISILFAAAFYQITCRMELAGILYAGLTYISFSRFAVYSYFLRWINPFIATYSDGFKSLWPIRIGFYTRLIWLCFAVGLWALSLLCLRKYQKKLLASFLWGIKKVWLPLLASAFLLAGTLLWRYQPFIDHGPEEWIWTYPEYGEEGADIEFYGRIASVQYSIVAHPVTGTVSGRAEYVFRYSDAVETSFTLNPGYKIKSMTYGGEPVDFQTVEDDINGERTTYFTLPAARNQTLVIEYSGMPTVERCMTPIVSQSVDRDYIVLDGRSLAPKMESAFITASCRVSVDITIPEQLTPYLNESPMTEYTDNQDGTKTWKKTDHNLFYIASFEAGSYVTDKITAADMEIDFAYGRIYEDVVREYDAVQAIADVFDYCTAHYGNLGFEADGHLLLRQMSSMFLGGYAVTGVSTWYEQVLSPTTLNDPARGASATEVFIHEIIHQWWGISLIDDGEDDLWSMEGLTVYSTYRLVKEKYGELYAQQYYVDMWERCVEEQNRNFYNRHPEYLDMLPEYYQARLREANRSVNLYMRMPLMILKAEKLVGGEEKMDDILRRIFEERDQYQFEPFTYQDFLDYCGLTEEDLRLE